MTPARPELQSHGAPITEDGRPVFVGESKVGEVMETRAEPLSWARLMVAGGVAGVSSPILFSLLFPFNLVLY